MAEKKTTTKKTAAEKKPTEKKTTRRSSKKTEAIPETVEQLKVVAIAETEAEFESKKVETKTIVIGEVIPDEGLKIRSGPGLNFDKIGKLKKGDEVEILEEKKDFVRIGHDQWCMKIHIGGI